MLTHLRQVPFAKCAFGQAECAFDTSICCKFLGICGICNFYLRQMSCRHLHMQNKFAAGVLNKIKSLYIWAVMPSEDRRSTGRTQLRICFQSPMQLASADNQSCSGPSGLSWSGTGWQAGRNWRRAGTPEQLMRALKRQAAKNSPQTGEERATNWSGATPSLILAATVES